MPFPARRLTTAVESWFARHQRPLPWRTTYDPYRVWLSEVMLQQTRMEVVLRYYASFVRRFPSLAALARASEDEVLAAWSGLGYYRRARMLREGAGEVLRRFEGELPAEAGALTTIPGVGRYTAGAISSIAHQRRAAIVDGNVARILSRLFGIAAPVGSPQLMREAWKHSDTLVKACRSPRDFNQGLMEIGALICKPRNPECSRCPVRRFCNAYATGRVDQLPLKKAAAPSRAMTIPLYIVRDRAGRVLMRRESGKLMTSMFHLPHGDTSLLTGQPLSVDKTALLGSFRHTITTRRIEFRVYLAEWRTDNPVCPDRIEDRQDCLSSTYIWVDPGQIADVPHASYVKKALALAARLQ